MNIDLTRNYFELFGFTESFEIDQDQLAEKYRTFQSVLHPDRFVNGTDQERRIAVQTTAFINKAYETLKSDLKRSHYLLKLSDIEFNADAETSSDGEFLMQTMELHEQVEEVSNASSPQAALDGLHTLSNQLKQDQQNLISQFSDQYRNNDLNAAKETALKLQFYERLSNQVRKKQEKCEEELI
ncbi:MAG: Fe-S protein assembly co-chaperone HscB [Gammaproteobacteria bacterium]